MNFPTACLVSVALAALGCSETGTQPTDPFSERAIPEELREEVAGVARANNQLAFDLYRAFADNETGNVFFSPFSISAALTMTLAGAAGDTETEMTETLRHTLGRDELHPAFGAILSSINRGSALPGYELTTANRLWCQQNMELLQEFRDITRDHYAAEPMSVDFAQDPDGARRKINDWVEAQTHDRIQDLFPAGSITSLTRLVLANAIYFKGRWQSPFHPDETGQREFWVEPDQPVPVPTMFQKMDARIADLGDAAMLELPYSGGDLSMLFVVPRDRDGLPGIEARIDAPTLDAWIDALQTRPDYEIYIPRFEFTWDEQLNPVLADLGMPSAFDYDLADFSRMTGQRGLAIQSVIHKAFVVVNEEGTEAAAATGVSVGITSLPPSFRADRPFLFLIRDHVTGAILFLGRVVNPAS